MCQLFVFCVSENLLSNSRLPPVPGKSSLQTPACIKREGQAASLFLAPNFKTRKVTLLISVGNKFKGKEIGALLHFSPQRQICALPCRKESA